MKTPQEQFDEAIEYYQSEGYSREIAEIYADQDQLERIKRVWTPIISEYFKN